MALCFAGATTRAILWHQGDNLYNVGLLWELSHETYLRYSSPFSPGKIFFSCASIWPCNTNIRSVCLTICDLHAVSHWCKQLFIWTFKQYASCFSQYMMSASSFNLLKSYFHNDVISKVNLTLNTILCVCRKIIKGEKNRLPLYI